MLSEEEKVTALTGSLVKSCGYSIWGVRSTFAMMGIKEEL